MRLAILTIAAAVVLLPAAVLVTTIAAAISLARDEDTHAADCVAPCCDPGPDDLEAVARVTGLVVFVSPEALIERCIDRLVEETCPDYVDEIVWGMR